MGKIIKNIILTLFALLEISPLIFLLSGSFMDNQEITGYISPVFNKDGGYATWGLVPSFPTLSNMAGVLLDSPEFFQMFWNTARITGLILAGQIVSGMPAAWGLARYQFKGRKVIYMVYIVMMMMPFQVTMLSQYLVLDNLGLLDTAAAVIIPGMFSTFPVFIMYRFFCGIPESIIEAARIDGAGEIQIFARLGIPLGSSGIISALVLSFLECFSMIEQPMAFLKTKSLWPLSLFLPDINGGNAGISLCASLLALMPAVFVFLAGQDYLEQGIASAAVKE